MKDVANTISWIKEDKFWNAVENHRDQNKCTLKEAIAFCQGLLIGIGERK